MKLDIKEECALNARAQIFLNGEQLKDVASCEDGPQGFVMQYDFANFDSKTMDEVPLRKTVGNVVIVDPAYPGQPLDRDRMPPLNWQHIYRSA